MQKTTLQKKPPYALGSVDNALRLIQTLRDTGTLRLVDAAAELGVTPSTAHRLFSMLVYRGFAIQDDNRVYLPGPSMGERPVLPSSTLRLKNLIHPYLELLSANSRETANLMIRVGVSIRFLSTVESANILRVGDRRGSVLSARSASGGKALLAELDTASLVRLFRRSVEENDTGFDSLLAELERIRQQGYAVNFEGTEEGVCAIGAAIRYRGASIAAISVSLPTTRLKDSVREELINSVLAARRDIEINLSQQSLEPLTL